MKRLLLVCLLFVLSGCNIQTVEHYEQQQAQIEKSVPQQQLEQTEVVEPVDEEPSDQTTPLPPKEDEAAERKQQPVVQPAEDVTEQKPEQQQAAEEAPQSASKPEAPQQVTESPKEPVQQQAVKPAEQAPASTPAPKPKQTVTIAIEAKTLLNPDHYAMLQKSLQQSTYVPADGIILAPTTYEIVKEGETVFDILQRAVREFNIHFEYEGADENIYDSVYIEGINHLYEFSAGNLSGWMYDVNGTAPAKGASQYVVQPNDVITWRYTVDLGKDLDGVVRE